MSPESEARLLMLMDNMVESNRRMEAKIDDLAQRVSRVEGRIEEQSKFLQLALASRSRRPAA